MKNKTRIFIVDDHAVIREGLALLINNEKDFEVCGQAEDADSAKNEILELKPDLAIIDISLKGGSGIELVRELNRIGVDLPFLVLSMHEESFYADRAIKAGAKGYIMKHETFEKLTQAIRHILSGKIYLSEKMMDQVLNAYAKPSAETGSSPLDSLTNRELEVLDMIGQGLTTREIAENIHLSKKTIGVYRERLKSKLGLKNAAELSKFAFNCYENKNQ